MIHKSSELQYGNRNPGQQKKFQWVSRWSCQVDLTHALINNVWKSLLSILGRSIRIGGFRLMADIYGGPRPIEKRVRDGCWLKYDKGFPFSNSFFLPFALPSFIFIFAFKIPNHNDFCIVNECSFKYVLVEDIKNRLKLVNNTHVFDPYI